MMWQHNYRTANSEPQFAGLIARELSKALYLVLYAVDL